MILALHERETKQDSLFFFYLLCITLSRRYSAHFPWDSKCQLCGIQYMDVHSSQRRIRHGKRIKIGMGLFSFSTKSPIATMSLSLLPLWCLLFPLVFLPLICASLLFSNFHIFFSRLLVFSFPLSSQFFLHLIPLALSSHNEKQRVRDGLWLSQCWSLTSGLLSRLAGLQ